MIRLQLSVKHFVDYTLALILFFLLTPVFLIISIWIKAADGGPILFKQNRIGKNGKKFMIYKFRSMVSNAENMGAGLAFDQNDLRITRPGKFIRSSSLDEIPQLFNILKGEMSFIGPRPTIESQVLRYNSFQRQRLEMKPGITGWAQVNGRNAIKWSVRIKYDVEYVKNWNLWFDVKIIIKTIFVVFTKKGVRIDQALTEVDDL